MRFKDKVAVVTGAARGIGSAIALGLVGEGAKAVLVDIDGEPLERQGRDRQSRRSGPSNSLRHFEEFRSAGSGSPRM
jgi:NAD(P)-dependent dehydrogenase (short-subunit alcohol dehydrogenase family)